MDIEAGAAPEARAVSRRRVFYIPGYDPIPPRRYRELYRTESAAQAAISGYEIALSPGRGTERFGWHVTARMDGAEIETDVEVLVWSDIVRDSMGHSIPATYLGLIRTAWTYIGTGALWRLMRLRKGPVIAALYPVGFLLAQLALAVAWRPRGQGPRVPGRPRGWASPSRSPCCAGSRPGTAGSSPIT